jgi:cellulose synthase/poly-beta-1,6-N-acetylglucosamine synthase-like glycosyltransferase
MNGLIWLLKTQDAFSMSFNFIIIFLVGYICFESDFAFLVMAWFWRLAFGKIDPFVSGSKYCPDGLVIIPTLLRNDEDYDGLILAIDSCANNEYPSQLVIIASIDGNAEHPELYEQLINWRKTKSYPQNVSVYITGTEKRHGKMMAVHAGAEYMKILVENGNHNKFPDVYFSFDADGIISVNSFERLAVKLATPHRFSKNPRRVVAGKMLIRKELIWNGWDKFFTIKGQIYLQVASQFIKACVARYNWRIVPKIGLSGVLYATWSDLLIQAPYYMGFLQTVKWIDSVKWWLGFGPPLFSKSNALPLPEALTGATDDTSMSFICMLAHWENGKLSLDAAQTPFHAFGRLFREWLIERSHDYDPEARVYTYTPSTIKGLWNQRSRWNSARIEVSIRFAKALQLHFELSFVVWYQFIFLAKSIIVNTMYYILLPYLLIRGQNLFTMTFFIYVFYTMSSLIYSVMALLLEREYKYYWRILYCTPFTMLYSIVINTLTQITGCLKDILFFGNRALFVPEDTLIKGKTVRIAILYRIRRFVLLCAQSVRYGQIPFGSWWLGFREHYPYVESGYKGWTSGKRSQYFVK